MTRLLLSICVALTVTLGMSELAVASSIDCEVTTIRANASGKGIDPSLKAFAEVLGKQPFAEFSGFELVDKKHYKLELRKPVSLELAAGLLGNLEYRGVTKAMISLQLTLTPPGKAPIRIAGSASPGAPLFAAGLKEATGILVLAVSCRDSNVQLVQ